MDAHLPVPNMGLDGDSPTILSRTIQRARNLRVFPLTDANDGDAKPASQFRSPEAFRFVNSVLHSLPMLEDIRRTFSARASAQTISADVITSLCWTIVSEPFRSYAGTKRLRTEYVVSIINITTETRVVNQSVLTPAGKRLRFGDGWQLCESPAGLARQDRYGAVGVQSIVGGGACVSTVASEGAWLKSNKSSRGFAF